MVKRKAPVTAEQLAAQLSQDPEYLARVAARDEALAQADRRYMEAIAPLMAELRKLGYNNEDPYDLTQSGVRYTTAVPVLTAWLPRVHDPKATEAIVRALSVPWARSAVPALLKAFRTVEDSSGGLRWAIGNALEVLADDAMYEDLAGIARDRDFGRAREMVVLGLGKMKNAQLAVPLLIELLADDEVAGHAVIALGKLGDPAARDAVAALANHPKAWVRAEVKKALARMGTKARSITSRGG